MLEYVFFQDAPRKQFQDFLTEQGLTWSLEPSDLETLVVVDETGLDEESAERIECLYDEIFAAEQVVQPPPPPPADDSRVIGFQLPGGRLLETRLPRELIERLLTVITPGELTSLAETIAQAAIGTTAEPPA
jgi:hypothetical protein